jgi:DNA-binding CsgD family transcriptional regulator
MQEPCHVYWSLHAIQAHTAAGRMPDAVRVTDWLEERGEVMPCRWPRFAALMGRGCLAESAQQLDAAEESYRAALTVLDGADIPIQRVEGLLQLGRLLRRQGKLIEARVPLSECLAISEETSARWFAGQAGAELRLARGRRRAHHASVPGSLTRAERRVVEQAAAGYSNAAIAERLHLSVNTVETHLKRAYTKLHLTSRRELMQMDWSAGDK